MIVRFDPQPEDLQALRVDPLGQHINSFAALISQQGYSRPNGWQKIGLVTDLNRWLKRKNLKHKQLGERQIEIFFKARWKRAPNRNGDRTTMGVFLRHRFDESRRARSITSAMHHILWP